MNPRLLLLGLIALVPLAGCKAKFSSSATFDGQPFTPTSCRNGDALGFVGVELTDANNRRIRLAPRADGQAEAYVFGSSDLKGASLGPCGVLVLGDSSGTVNKIRNIGGKATVSCSAKEGTLAGEIVFENCH